MIAKNIKPIAHITDISTGFGSTVLGKDKKLYIYATKIVDNMMQEAIIYSVDKDGIVNVFATIPDSIGKRIGNIYSFKDLIIVALNAHYFGKLYAYSLQGELRWVVDCEEPINRITSTKDTLIATAYQDNNRGVKVFSITECGEIAWKNLLGRIWLEPLVSKNRIFIGVNDGIAIYDFNGNRIKSINVTPGNPLLNSPIINPNSNLIHIATNENKQFISIDDDGTIKRTTDFPFKGIFIGVAFLYNNVSDDYIYVIDMFRFVYKLNTKTNSIDASAKLSDTTAFPPIIFKNHCIIHYGERSNCKICVTDENLNLVKSYKLKGEPVFVNTDDEEYIYAVTNNRKAGREYCIYRFPII